MPKSEARREAESYRMRWYGYIGMSIGVVAHMGPDERARFEAWNESRPHDVGTSEWPGFEQYIGKPPVPPDIPLPFKKVPLPSARKMAIFRRDGFACKACGADQNLTIDHVIPELKGGSNEDENLQTLCRKCNSKKGSR
jgi:HNH endonuclease